jgi:hypothetical protein
MLTTCFGYADAVSLKQKSSPQNQGDLEIALRTELAKICEAREEAVLAKHDVSRDEYAASLQEHRKNAKIQQ